MQEEVQARVLLRSGRESAFPATRQGRRSHTGATG